MGPVCAHLLIFLLFKRADCFPAFFGRRKIVTAFRPLLNRNTFGVRNYACVISENTLLFSWTLLFFPHTHPICFVCAQGVFSSYAKKASFPLFSGGMASDGAHGTWITTEYAQCILCGTVGFRRSFWIRWYVGVGTTRPFVSLYCCTAVCGSPLSMCFRRYHLPYPRSNFTMPSVRRPWIFTPRL